MLPVFVLGRLTTKIIAAVAVATVAFGHPCVPILLETLDAIDA